MAQLEQFATEPLVTPAGVLLRQPQDQGARPGRERGAPRPTAPAEGYPLPSDQFSVPAQESLRPNRERRPVGPGEATAQGREDQAVARAPGDPRGAAPQDPHVVAE